MLKELAISDAQKRQLDELFAGLNEQMREYFLSRRQLESSEQSGMAPSRLNRSHRRVT